MFNLLVLYSLGFFSHTRALSLSLVFVCKHARVHRVVWVLAGVHVWVCLCVCACAWKGCGYMGLSLV